MCRPGYDVGTDRKRCGSLAAALAAAYGVSRVLRDDRTPAAPPQSRRERCRAPRLPRHLRARAARARRRSVFGDRPEPTTVWLADARNACRSQSARALLRLDPRRLARLGNGARRRSVSLGGRRSQARPDATSVDAIACAARGAEACPRHCPRILREDRPGAAAGAGRPSPPQLSAKARIRRLPVTRRNRAVLAAVRGSHG